MRNYTTWCKNAKNPIPHYIDKEFKNYLGCGILAKGSAYAHSEKRGETDGLKTNRFLL